jgi:general L-amino acid transport system permease protein
LGLIIVLPLLAHWVFGAALHWDIPHLRGFNFQGGMVLIPELAALTIALSVYTSAFIAEIIRSGIQSVPYGQHEAARSLGLPNPVTLRQVIIPQALRVIIPPLTSQYLNIAKTRLWQPRLVIRIWCRCSPVRYSTKQARPSKRSRLPCRFI